MAPLRERAAANQNRNGVGTVLYRTQRSSAHFTPSGAARSHTALTVAGYCKPMRLLSVQSLLSGQLLAVGVAFVSFALWPPADGSLLLVPLDGSTQGEVTNIAMAGGAALLRRGGIPGSLVVSGNRSDIAGHLAGHRILILAGNGITCGPARRKQT